MEGEGKVVEGECKGMEGRVECHGGAPGKLRGDQGRSAAGVHLGQRHALRAVRVEQRAARDERGEGRRVRRAPEAVGVVPVEGRGRPVQGPWKVMEGHGRSWKVVEGRGRCVDCEQKVGGRPWKGACGADTVWAARAAISGHQRRGSTSRR